MDGAGSWEELVRSVIRKVRGCCYATTENAGCLPARNSPESIIAPARATNRSRNFAIQRNHGF